MDPMAEIRETFFQECEEQLGELESGLMRMETGQTDSETVNAVFRAVHSIKGGAGAFGLEDLVHFAHVFETVLDLIRSGRLEPSPEAMRVMLRASDALADLVRAARDGSATDPARIAAIVAELRQLTGEGDAGEAEDDDFADIAFAAVPVTLESEDAPPPP
ncbi:MAG: chemotaxis protein CheA, partial [Acidiphilium sp. 37-67-22]